MQETAIGEGAKVSEHGIIETFDNDEEALDAFDNGIVVCTYITLISKISILSIDTCFIGRVYAYCCFEAFFSLSFLTLSWKATLESKKLGN